MRVRKHGFRMNVGAVLPLLDLDPPLRDRNIVRPRRASGRRRSCRSSPPRNSFSCGGKPYRWIGAFAVPPFAPTKVSPDKAARSSTSSSAPQIAEPEKFPPDRLVLAAVPVERIGEQPARMLFCRPLVRVRGHVRRQARDQRVDSLLPLAQLLARAPVGNPGTRDVAALLDQGRTAVLQPVAQSCRGEAIVLIVARDHVEVGLVDELGVVELEMRLEPGSDRLASASTISRSYP